MRVVLRCDYRVKEGKGFLAHRPFAATGQLDVEEGQQVTWDTPLGSFPPSQRLRNVRVETSEGTIIATVLVEKGKKVKRGEVLAYYSYLFGLGYTEYIAPCDGEVVNVSDMLGIISIKEAPVSLPSHVPGHVKRADDALGVWVQSLGDALYGATGVGHGRSGLLDVRVSEPGEVLPPSAVEPEHAGAVIVTAGVATRELLDACLRYRVAGVVAGGVSYDTFDWYKGLTDSLDWDEFLARYWVRDAIKPEKAPSPLEIAPVLVVTEGYGDLSMGQDALDLLKKHRNKRVFVDGSDGNACVFVPLEIPRGEQEKAETLAAGAGDPVTVLRASGERVSGVLVDPQQREVTMDNGLSALCVKVKVGEGVEEVPLLNVVCE